MPCNFGARYFCRYMNSLFVRAIEHLPRHGVFHRIGSSQLLVLIEGGGFFVPHVVGAWLMFNSKCPPSLISVCLNQAWSSGFPFNVALAI